MMLAIVDDDVDVRQALHRLLRSLGHQVRSFASAEEFEAQPIAIDCLILDIRLPGLNGYELKERLQAAGRLPPIVFITGDRDRPVADEYPDGVTTLSKPFDEEALRVAIGGAVTRQHRTQ